MEALGLLQETLNLCAGKQENSSAQMFQTRVDLHKHREKSCPIPLDTELYKEQSTPN